MSDRISALKLGIISHLMFGIAIILMFVSLYGNFYHYIELFVTTTADVIWNTFSLLLFVFAHSFLLTNKGKGILRALAPTSIAKQLETTSFATYSSLLLLFTFAFWQPYDSGVFMFPYPVHLFLSIVYVFSWLLLGYSMVCAGLGIQKNRRLELLLRLPWRGKVFFDWKIV